MDDTKNNKVERGILTTILALVGANLILDGVRAGRDSKPTMEPIGQGTGKYIFSPSKGGGNALVDATNDEVRVRRISGTQKQRRRIQKELSVLFDHIVLDLVEE